MKKYGKQMRFRPWFIFFLLRHGHLTKTPYKAVDNLDNQNLIREAGAISELTRLLDEKHSSIETRKEAVWALGKLADGNVTNQDAIREAGAIERLLPLLGLDSATSTLRQYAIWTLGTLAGNHLVNSSEIGNLGAIAIIVDHLNVDNEATREDSSWTLGNLAFENTENKLLISSSNGIEKLVTLLSDKVEEVRREASIALAYIAEESPVYQAAVREAGAIPLIVKLLADEHEEVIYGAASALSSLCENCSENLTIVRQEGGLQLLKKLAADSSMSSDVREKVIEALQVCSSEHATSSSTTATVSNDDNSSCNNSCSDSVDSGGIIHSSSESSGGADECSNSSVGCSDTTHENSSDSSDHNTMSAATSSDHTLSAPASDADELFPAVGALDTQISSMRTVMPSTRLPSLKRSRRTMEINSTAIVHRGPHKERRYSSDAGMSLGGGGDRLRIGIPPSTFRQEEDEDGCYCSEHSSRKRPASRDYSIAQPEHSKSSKSFKHIDPLNYRPETDAEGEEEESTSCPDAEINCSSSEGHFVYFSRKDVDPESIFRVSVVPELTIAENLKRFKNFNPLAFNILMRDPKECVLVFKVPLITDISWVISLSEVKGKVNCEGNDEFLMSEVLNSRDVKKPIYINITAMEQEKELELDI